jgi:hypothetical protein
MGLKEKPFPATVGGYDLPSHRFCEEGVRRDYNLDIPEMAYEDLRVERFKVQRAYVAAYGRRIYVHTTRLENFVTAEEWLRYRLRALDAEMARRNGRRPA